MLIADVNRDGLPEITFSGIVGAHSALLWVLRWDGSTLVPLFEAVSSTPVVSLSDLDDDGLPEIVLLQSGYCGSYAASPSFSFVFRWDGAGYRSASMRYPSVNDGVGEHASGMLDSFLNDPQTAGARACIQHMLATVNAFRGRPTETRAAYRSYADLRRQSDERSPIFARPVYLGEAYVEADLRAVLAAAEAGQSADWTSADLAVLHDLIGDALDVRALDVRPAGALGVRAQPLGGGRAPSRAGRQRPCGSRAGVPGGARPRPGRRRGPAGTRRVARAELDRGGWHRLASQVVSFGSVAS